MNKRLIRYDEVILWKAEVLIQLDRQDEALPLINKIRQRAANSLENLKTADGSYILNYKWENRLELACEGRRFFDLQRWGTLEKTMNAYFAVERNRFDWMNIARFTAGRDEFFPISQAQMKWAKGNYTQNPGY